VGVVLVLEDAGELGDELIADLRVLLALERIGKEEIALESTEKELLGKARMDPIGLACRLGHFERLALPLGHLRGVDPELDFAFGSALRLLGHSRPPQSRGNGWCAIEGGDAKRKRRRR